MSDEDKASDVEKRAAARRRFLNHAGQVAVTTPAVTLLLAAGTKSGARAGGLYQAGDDGTDSSKGSDAGQVDGPGNDLGGNDTIFSGDGHAPGDEAI